MPKQLPFAMSKALNDTAFRIRKQIVKKSWPRSVNVKARGFANAAFRVDKAGKRRLKASVYDRLGSRVFDRLIHGKPHFPYRGAHLAIPVARRTKLITAGGKLSAIGKRALTPGTKGIYEADFGRGPGIWKDWGKQGHELLFVLKPMSRTPKKFDFYGDSDRVARRFLPVYMKRAVQYAIRTAR